MRSESVNDVQRSQLVADVARAGSFVAPYWPLTSFVAVNPLGGLQDRPFSEATALARSWFGARTHLPLTAYRAEHGRGAITDADLDGSISRHVPALAAMPPVRLGHVRVDPVDLLRWDLLHGPAGDEDHLRPDPVADALDEILATWCATYVDDDHVPWAMPDRDRGFYRSWRAIAAGDRRFVKVVGDAARRRIDQLPDDPVEMLALALETRAVDEGARVAAIRTLVLRTPGWASFARWCDDWAPADHSGVRLKMLDLAAVRAAMDHLAPHHLRIGEIGETNDETSETDDDDGTTTARVDAVADAYAPGQPTIEELTAVASVIELLDQRDRLEVWLSAHEWSLRDRLLMRLENPTTRDERRPAAQLMFCIDVRSEVFRRHLESLGDYETFGFAGFFGVPVRWRPLGSDVAEARCPVLVSPRHEIVEAALDDDDRYLATCSATAGLSDAFHAAKGGIGSPFALAESAGWFAGPAAALRTLAPARTSTNVRTPTARRWWQRFASQPRTTAVVDDHGGTRGGLSLEERTLFAEAIVTTIGMTVFAPLVVLCGHGSQTTNNPHASSLDCGACGGAPGGASARIAAAILNDRDVRAGLLERGVEIPDDTLFVAAEHDTAADVVTVLDADELPVAARPHIAALQRDLEAAGQGTANERAKRLPGDAARVRDRGRDWAQVRPEWGLAGNAAFVIGPRSNSAGVDLGGRAFLHSYVADLDHDGVALETIMTAPLVVAQWISAQYYFSTVAPEVFGAGDKMLHNPVGGIGVVVGESGDLAVGLPMQSVMIGEQRAHDPLRLLAIVQAPLDRIEQIILRNSGLRQLVEGEWIHVVARPTEQDAWSTRTPAGGWAPWQPADPDHAATAALLTPLEIS